MLTFLPHVEQVINAGDALETLSGGYYIAAIHRVVQPPPDQRAVTRLGVYYFATTNDNITLVPLVSESTMLQELELRGELMRRCADGDAPTMAESMAARIKGLATGEYEWRQCVPGGQGENIPPSA